jgi:hypothetical protein
MLPDAPVSQVGEPIHSCDQQSPADDVAGRHRHDVPGGTDDSPPRHNSRTQWNLSDSRAVNSVSREDGCQDRHVTIGRKEREIVPVERIIPAASLRNYPSCMAVWPI